MPISVIVDWDRNGDYGAGDYGEGGYGGLDFATDVVTSLVRPQHSTIAVDYGRDQSTALAPTVAGHGSLVLDNSDRRFSPRNILSPLYGKLKPARPVQITRSINVNTLITSYESTDLYDDTYFDTYDTLVQQTSVVAGEVTYPLFRGHTDDSPINPDVNSKTVTLSLIDSIADFRGQNISTSLYAGIRTGEAIGIILDECGWTGPRNLDSGASVLPWWWEDGTDALDALEKLIRCEGPPALLTITTDGGIEFKDRHHRLVDIASITSQSVWQGVGGNEPVMSLPFIYDDAWRNIINTGQISVDVRTPSALEAVWALDSPIGFIGGETKTFIASASDPFLNAVEPVEGTDYTIISGGLLSIFLSRTSGASTMITIVAGGAGAQISNLQLRAQPVQTAYTVQVAASDAVSIADYGARSFPGDLPFCNQYDAQAVLNTAVEIRSQSLPVITARFMVGKNVDRAVKVLTRDLSDRVTIIEPETVLNDDFYVESIAHELTGEHDHSVTVGLEAVPPDGAVTASNVFLIGGGVGHQIGDGVLAS